MVLSLPLLPSAFPILMAVGASIGAGIFGSFRPTRVTDGASLLLLSAGFVSAGIFAAQLSILRLYMFASLGLLTFQLMSFRTTTAPLRRRPSLDDSTLRGLSSVYQASLVRGLLVSSLVLMISIMTFMAATGFVLGLTADVTAFLLALAVLVLLAIISTYHR